MFTTNWNEQETEDPSRKKLCFPEKRGGMGIFKQRMEIVHDSAEKMEHKEKKQNPIFSEAIHVIDCQDTDWWEAIDEAWVVF